MLAPRLKQALLVTIVAAIVMLTNLGGPRLWDRDEPRNAGCAREMLSRGDWVVPTFNATLRTHKPVLVYWCMMLSYSVLGVSEFSARLPSAICAIGTALCTWHMGRRLFSQQAGVWAAIALVSTLMFCVAGRAATPDSVFIFATTLSAAIYVAGTFRRRYEGAPPDAPPLLVTPGHYFPQHWPTATAMYAAMGLAVLAKGPVGLVLPTAVIGMFLLIMRLPAETAPLKLTLGRFVVKLLRPFEPLHFLKTCWYMRPLTAIFAAAAIAVPWYWAVGLATEGEFLRGFLWEHNVGRATRPMEGHGGAIFFYPIAILLGFFPWSVFAVPVILDTAVQTRRRENLNAAFVFAACWVSVYVIAFSIARTKLPSYITPCYPAIALLVGSYIDRWSRDAFVVARTFVPISFGVLAICGAGFAVAAPIVAKKYLPGDEWLGLLGLTPLAAGVACLGLTAVRNYRGAAITFAGSAVAFVLMLFTVGAQRADEHQKNHIILRAMFERSADPQIASYRVLEPSWVFYAGRPIRELNGKRQVLRERYAGPQPLLTGDPAQQAAQHLATSPDAFLITTDRRLDDLAPLLPPGAHIVAETDLFLKGERLLLIGRANSAELAHGQAPMTRQNSHR